MMKDYKAFYLVNIFAQFPPTALSYNRYHLETVRTNMGFFQKPANHTQRKALFSLSNIHELTDMHDGFLIDKGKRASHQSHQTWSETTLESKAMLNSKHPSLYCISYKMQSLGITYTDVLFALLNVFR